MTTVNWVSNTVEEFLQRKGIAMSNSKTRLDDLNRRLSQSVETIECPRCHICSFPTSFYCTNCGYVPPKKEER